MVWRFCGKPASAWAYPTSRARRAAHQFVLGPQLLLFGQGTKPTTGAVLVCDRGSGGHVGFAVGQDDTHFYVLGGNQSDAVTIARIAQSRLLGARWPATYPPRPQRLPTMKAGEFLATTNEV